MKFEFENGQPDAVTGARALTLSSTAKLLDDIIEQCGGKRLLFDLDSTLLDNRPRNAVIMREFAQEYSQSLLSNACADDFPTWSAEDTMASLGLSENQILQVKQPYFDYWLERFFTSEYCKHDIEVAGASCFVNDVVQADGIVTYLTGRNETMRPGTHQSLLSHGFPEPGVGSVELRMKPKAEDSDDVFKQKTLEALAQKESIIAAFDNEPMHINSYRRVFPDACCVHLHTDHSMREVRLLEGVLSIRDFQRRLLDAAK